MSKSLLIIPLILIMICIMFTIVKGIDMNEPESTIEYHKVVSIMDDGRYLIESPDGDLYIYDGDLQDVEPGNYIIIQSRTKGSLLNMVLYVLLGIASIISLLVLLGLASDTRHGK